MRLTSEDKALIITFSGASLLVLAFFFLGVKPYENPIPEEFFEIPVLAEQLEQEKTPPVKQAPRKSIKSHRAFNSEEVERFQNDPVREAIAQQQAQSVSDLTGANDAFIAEQRAAREQKRLEALQKIDEEKRKQAEAQLEKKANTRQTTISYALKDRVAFKIPNPVYTCEATGIVVIDITVTAGGTIKKATYNKAASQTSNGCLVDQALQYARKALFNSAITKEQKGTISFDFQG